MPYFGDVCAPVWALSAAPPPPPPSYPIPISAPLPTIDTLHWGLCRNGREYNRGEPSTTIETKDACGQRHIAQKYHSTIVRRRVLTKQSRRFMGNQFALSAFYRVRQVVDEGQASSRAVSQTNRQTTAQLNAVPKDCGVSYRTPVSAVMQRRGEEEAGPAVPSLTFNAAVKYGVPLSGATTATATGDSFHSQNVSFPTRAARQTGRPADRAGKNYDGPARTPVLERRTVIYFRAVGSGAVGRGSREMAPFNVTQL